MGHAHHFLSRLDRVDSAEVELALALYRDPDALRYVFGKASLPDRAERVAVELGAGPAPPSLIVTRDGRFVTCLGAGMRHDLPVVARATLDAAVDELAVRRQHEELGRALRTGEARGLDETLAKLGDGPDVSREDMTRLASLAPVLLKPLLRSQLELTTKTDELRRELVRALRKTKNLRPAARGQLESYFRASWSVAHLAVITGTGLGARARELAGDRFDNLVPVIGLGSLRSDAVGLAAHGLYGMCRLGPRALPTLAAQFARSRDGFQAMSALLGTLGIVARHPEAREEALERLYSPGPDASALAKGLGPVAAELEALLFLDPSDLTVAWPLAGAEVFVNRAKARLPEGHPLRFEVEEDVPLELARPTGLRLAVSFQRSREGVLLLASTLPWFAEARVEDLYLPADVLAWMRAPWREERSLRLLQGHVDADSARVEANVRPAGPTRGGPCPCGSRKKYKRCCGETAR